ncbi:MAG: alpha-amylase family glycosyl hydrolase [Propioniciclava sp.]
MSTPRPVRREHWARASWPLGAHVRALGTTTFAVVSTRATRVQIEFYPEAVGADADAVFWLERGDDGVWRGEFDRARHGTLYAFRAWGENWLYDEAWVPGSAAGFFRDLDGEHNHFNPNKVLFDPYAREITHTTLSALVDQTGADRGIFGWGPRDWRGRPVREADTARQAPKGIVIEDATGTGRPPRHPEQDHAIYETHVKNLTLHPSTARLNEHLAGAVGFEAVADVPGALRGTYAGASLMAPYLRDLGVNVIEFLPVQETDSDQVGSRAGTTNHWGYQTLGFFAPNRDYSSDRSPGGPTREFKQMVSAFHDHGIEVFIDVVHNHTAEGGNWGDGVEGVGFTTLGGFATTEYYALLADGSLIDGATGTSNQMNYSSVWSQQLVVDSLQYWHESMGVDGFRFDLAPVLGRRPNAAEADDWEAQRRFYPDHPLLAAISGYAADQDITVIAEAWDLWGYEVGNFPPGWGEWNGRFRDAMRRFLKGDGNTGDFMAFFNGDHLHFNANGGPHKSVNFVTAHDGFTMMDLVSYDHKVNDQPSPFGPTDGGSDDNLSWSSGGDQQLRRTRWRNFWLITFLARGVPMVVSGDEYGRTQNGNNNPWSLNTVGVWNNWAQAGSNAPTRIPVDPGNPDLPGYHDVIGQTAAAAGVNPLLAFARYVAQLRREQPTLRQRRWGDLSVGGSAVSYVYFGTDLHAPPRPGDRQIAVAIDGGESGGDDFWVLVNMYDEPGHFDLSEWADSASHGHEWRRIVDTSAWAESENNSWPLDEGFVVSGEYTVDPWSIVVLQAHPVGRSEPSESTIWGRGGGLHFEFPNILGTLDEALDLFRRGTGLFARANLAEDDDPAEDAGGDTDDG